MYLIHHPDTIPTDLPAHKSTYNFDLSSDDIEEQGIFGAVSRCLEVCLGQHRDGNIHFKERGQSLERMIRMMKSAVKQMNEMDRQAFEDAWLNRLIQAAKDAGARIPKMKQKEPQVIVHGSEPSAGGSQILKRKTPENPESIYSVCLAEPVTKKSRVIISIDESDDNSESTHQSPSNLAHTTLSPLNTQFKLHKPTPQQGKILFTKDTSTLEEKEVARSRRIKHDNRQHAKAEADTKAAKEKKVQHKRELA